MVAGCSNSDPAIPAEATAVATIAPPTSTALPNEESSVPADGDAGVDTTLAVDVVLAVQAAGESAPLQADVSGSVDSSNLTDADVFGDFASCSGARRSFGPYSVLVSSADGPVSAVSVLTETSVTAAGIYDADVRVELSSGQIESATGTATISSDFRSGSFMAFTSEGGSVSGTFECSGGENSPLPLAVVEGDASVLETAEVVALMRRGSAERVVGFTVDVARSPSVILECSAATGGTDSLLVYLDGDQSVGAITTFELTSGDNPSMRLRVGGQSYEFEDVDITIGSPATAGTFSASGGGLFVDGAFRCA